MSSSSPSKGHRRRKNKAVNNMRFVTHVSARSAQHRDVFGDPILQPRYSGIPFKTLNRVYDYSILVDQGQLTSAGPWVSSNAAATFFATSFRLSFVAQAASYIGLYDQYRIRMVDVVLVPRANVSSASTGVVGANLGTCYAFVDDDDETVPASIAVCQERQNCVIEPCYKPIHLTFVPHIIAVGAGPTNSLNMEPPWMNTAVSNVAHYAIKAGITQSATVSTYDVFTELHIQFRNVA